MTEPQYRAQFSADVRFSGGGLQARVSASTCRGRIPTSRRSQPCSSPPQPVDGREHRDQWAVGLPRGARAPVVVRATSATPTAQCRRAGTSSIWPRDHGRTDHLSRPARTRGDAHLTRAGSREYYAPGVEFAIDRVSMVGNTGTYLDSRSTARRGHRPGRTSAVFTRRSAGCRGSHTWQPYEGGRRRCACRPRGRRLCGAAAHRR